MILKGWLEQQSGLIMGCKVLREFFLYNQPHHFPHYHLVVILLQCGVDEQEELHVLPEVCSEKTHNHLDKQEIYCSERECQIESLILLTDSHIFLLMSVLRLC